MIAAQCITHFLKRRYATPRRIGRGQPWAEAHGYCRAAATRREFWPFLRGFGEPRRKTHVPLARMWVMTSAEALGDCQDVPGQDWGLYTIHVAGESGLAVTFTTRFRSIPSCARREQAQPGKAARASGAHDSNRACFTLGSLTGTIRIVRSGDRSSRGHPGSPVPPAPHHQWGRGWAGPKAAAQPGSEPSPGQPAQGGAFGAR